MPRLRNASLRLALLLSAIGSLPGSGCASRTLPGDIEPLPAGTRVRLSDVYFDYATWVRSTTAEKERAKEWEGALTGALRDAFVAEAKRIGIWDDGPDAVKVTIALVDTDPGSTIGASWLGYSAGDRRANADVTLRGHGTFEIGIVIPDDDVRGPLEELGRRIARHIEERTR